MHPLAVPFLRVHFFEAAFRALYCSPQVRTPEGLTGEHVDIIKLTAQCVARNGPNFLTGKPEFSSSLFNLKRGHQWIAQFSHTEVLATCGLVRYGANFHTGVQHTS